MATASLTLQRGATAALGLSTLQLNVKPVRNVSALPASFHGAYRQVKESRHKRPAVLVRATSPGADEPVPIWAEETEPVPVWAEGENADQPLAVYQEAPSLNQEAPSLNDQEDMSPSDTDPAEEAARRTADQTFPDDAKALKQQLMDTVYGTDRGMKAGNETQAEIAEIISQLEARNPTPAPTQSLDLLNGKWNLVYTSFSDLSPLLALSNLPIVKINNISQTIDTAGLTLENRVEYKGPVANNFFAASASFEVRSPSRIQVKFEEGTLGTPQLHDGAQVPRAVSILGQQVDLSLLQSALRPVSDVAEKLADNISRQPPLKFPIKNGKAEAWLLTTYLDEDLRISRGSGGGLFVLVKEGSSLS